MQVPIELLRFRKDNGRISSDVQDYETRFAVLDEKDDRDQEKIAGFLRDKDTEKTEDLRRSIMHRGQEDPAIITCDGFLINGNRRKMVMGDLHAEHPGDNRFAYMKVVILPGKDEDGGPPSLLEIEKIENRYQLQSDGKADYSRFDKALSIKRKIEMGLSLTDQLEDDPRNAGFTKAQLDKRAREYEKDFLEPLRCADRYLAHIQRGGQYTTISTGTSDKEGRWEAFIDYATLYTGTFKNPKKLTALGISEDEIGQIEAAVFNVIRLRTIPGMPKLHEIIRRLPKYCSTPEGKERILKIADEVKPDLPEEQQVDDKGLPLSISEVDAKWAALNKQTITWCLKKATETHEDQRERDTPLELLEAAHKKLTHEGMVLTAISPGDYKRARHWAKVIGARANELENEIYQLEKNGKKSSR